MDKIHKVKRVKELMKDDIWVDEPIDVTTWTVDGEETLLHLASYRGNFEVVKLLVELGANVNALGDLNHTALHYAARNKNKDIYDYLLAHGADTKIKSQLGTTALDEKE